jgi:precorrin-2 dehydrogenase / sirohydrochlorin ferrochelatase
MIPIMLDPAMVRVAVCGEGVLTLRRLKWLHECGAKPLVFAPLPSLELKELAGDALVTRLPVREDFDGLAAIWIADMELDVAAPLAQLGREACVLVNVEDVLDYCDFHTPAIVHRGRLTFAISTGGASPAIASIIRQRLETAFPPAWAELVDEIAKSRLALKANGATFSALVADANIKLSKSGL